MVAQTGETVKDWDDSYLEVQANASGWEFRARRLRLECVRLQRDLEDTQAALVEAMKKKREIAAECSRLREVIAREVRHG